MSTKYTREEAEKIARSRGCTDPVMLIGFRRKDSEFGKYDDILALLTPDSYTEYVGNTMPSKWEHLIACLQPGDYRWKKGLHGIHHFDDITRAEDAGLVEKGTRAAIETWLSEHIGQDHMELRDKNDNHIPLPYWAFRQAGPMIIIRHGSNQEQPEPDGWPNAPAWIDGHCGGRNTTSSLACQTWQPDGWAFARRDGYAAMDAHRQEFITYALHQME